MSLQTPPYNEYILIKIYNNKKIKNLFFHQSFSIEISDSIAADAA
jgi:hypothetical protein